ncbi:MAG: SAM-dependent methyltransferase [Candidatus Latescibacterota bacterium]|jgi:SAM-dependent methyltransferase
MTWDSTVYVDHFDFVVMELGILHYLVDLVPLFALIQRILSPGGHYVLHEFHPFSRKGNPEKEGDRVYLSGDYFDEEVVMARPAPYSFAFGEKEVADFPLCPNRYWTFGEMITSAIASGMTLKHLTEQPHGEITTMPATFILVAQK